MRTRVDATRGALLPLTVRLAIPVIASELLWSSYAFVDLGFLAHAGEAAAHAAVAALFPILVMNAALFKMTQLGTLALVAQFTGAGRSDRVAAAMGQGLWIGGICAAALALIGGVGAEWLVAPVCPLGPDGGPDPAVLAAGATYLRILFVGAPLTHLAVVLDATFKGRGDTVTPLVLEAVGLGTNILCTGALVAGWGGAPQMGAAGAAISTLVSRAVVLGGGMAVLWRGRQAIRPAWRFERPLAAQMLRIGAPQGLSMLAYSGAMTVVFHMAAALGPAASSALGIGIRQIEFIAFTHYVGINSAAATIVGQNLGAGAIARARRGAWTAIGVGVALGAVATVAFVGFHAALAETLAGPIGPAVVALTSDYVQVIGLSQMVLAADIVGVGAFIGAGQTALISIASIASLALRVGLVAGLVHLGWGFDAITWGMTLSSALKGFATLAMLGAGLWLPRALSGARLVGAAPAVPVPVPSSPPLLLSASPLPPESPRV